MEYALDQLSIASLQSIRIKRSLDTSRKNKKGQTVGKIADNKEEREGEEAEVVLKCKRQDEEEVSGSKKVKPSKARTLKKHCSSSHQEVLPKKKTTNANSPKLQPPKLPQNPKFTKVSNLHIIPKIQTHKIQIATIHQ
uniref:Uncharacterized protein n=1 Tax=Cucumis melo TaxID=3656 RepID=A0A9I9CVD5_CUCME